MSEKPPFYEPSTLVDRLQGIYRIAIKDGLGAVAAGEEPDNPNEFVRKFEGFIPAIQHEAAHRIGELEAQVQQLQVLLEEAKLGPGNPNVGNIGDGYI